MKRKKSKYLVATSGEFAHSASMVALLMPSTASISRSVEMISSSYNQAEMIKVNDI